jgi:DNA polymerase-1
MMTTTALIDADIVVYQAASRAQESVDWGDEITSSVNKPRALGEAKLQVEAIAEAVGADDVVLCFSDAANFRKEVYPSYKSNRKGSVKPLGFEHVKTWLMDHHQFLVKPGLEADDVLGILLTRETADKRVCCSIDKDLLTVPGRHYNWDRGTKAIVSPEDAEYLFYEQILTGDSVDGYPGCPGIGPVRATKLFEDVEPGRPRWEVIVEAYEKKGLTEADAITQARCARILREGEFDYQYRRPILWTPPAREEETCTETNAA